MDAASHPPAPTNRACSSCARAKAKCIPHSVPGHQCERCHRLQKQCESSPAKSRGAPRRRKPLEASRVTKNSVEKLEEKLDGLVTLLKGTREAEAAGNDVEPALLPGGSKKPSARSISIVDSSPNPSPANVEEMTQNVDANAEYSSSESHRGGHPYPKVRQLFDLPSMDGTSISDAEAQHTLEIFREEMCQAFPFIVLHESTVARDLRRDRPIFFLSILAVSVRNHMQHISLGKFLIKQLAERVFINGERNMDLLLGTLTYAGWCYFHFFNVPQLSSLMSTAFTLVYDLGLNRPIISVTETMSLYETAIRTSCGCRKPARNLVRTLEEQRALLGCFYLSYVISSFFRRIDPLPHTPYIDQCCNDLTDVEFHTNDRYAVALVKLQAISERINKAPWNVRSEAPSATCPPMLFVSALEQQLQRYEIDNSSEISKNFNLRLSFYAAEFSLYKVGLSRLPSLALSSDRNFDRLKLLHACLQSLRSFYDTFHAIPASEYHCLSAPMWTNLTHSHIILQGVSSFEHPDDALQCAYAKFLFSQWNLEYARRVLNLSDTLLQFADRMESASKILGFDKHPPQGSDMFAICARKTRNVEEYCRLRMTNPPSFDAAPPVPMELSNLSEADMNDGMFFLES